MKNIYILLAFVLAQACMIKDRTSNRDVEIIEVTKKMFNDDIDYSGFIDSIEIVRFETNEQSLIGSVTKIMYLNEKYYIFDRTNQSILIFDSDGKFIDKLHELGRGPGEYSELRDFDIDTDGTLCILTNNRILLYNSSLDIVGEKKLSFLNQNKNFSSIVLFATNNNFFFLFSGSFGLANIEKSKNYAIHCVDENNKILGNYFPVIFKYPYTHQTFYKSNNRLNISSTLGNDTIYYVDKSSVLPAIYIDFAHKITESDMVSSRSVIYEQVKKNNLMGGVQKIYENSDYLCFIFTVGHQRKQAVYNKNTKTIKILNLTDKSLPFPWIMVNGVVNNSFFSFVEPHVLDIGSENSTIKDLLNKRNIKDLKLTDNPIIFKYTFNF